MKPGSDSAIQRQLQRALHNNVELEVEAKGYVITPTDNLIDGVFMDQFEDDLRRGDGNELRMKFCAVHSSAALAVNAFAWFRAPGRLSSLTLFGMRGANALEFEHQFPIFSRGRAPNLDVWIERDHENVAIESKLTEYLSKKTRKFSKVYDRLAPPALSEACWWIVYERAKRSESGFLDIAQLVKHYFGLRTFQEECQIQKPLRLLYLFWEPINWQQIPACVQHRNELRQLGTEVSTSAIRFEWMTYSQLWEEWAGSGNVELAEHADDLRRRYEVSAESINGVEESGDCED